MRTAWRRLCGSLRQFYHLESGLAAVEFALVLPIMLVLYIGAMEASTMISMDRRVQSVSGAVGDLVARADTTISAATLTDYFLAAGGIMTPFPTAGLSQVVTQLSVDKDGVAIVVWSKQYVNGIYGTNTALAIGSVYNLAKEMVAISKSKTVIVAKADFTYLPLYGLVFKNPVQLSRVNFFLPRFGGTITVD